MKLKISEKLRRYRLKNKLEKILSKANIRPCKDYQNNIINMNFKIKNYYEGKSYINKQINDSLRFSYSMHHQDEEEKENKFLDFNLNNEVDFLKERDYLFKLIITQLTFEEIKMIFHNPEFYISNDSLRELLDFFQKSSKLYEILTNEEKEGIESEDEKLKKILKIKKNEIIQRHRRNISDMTEKMYNQKKKRELEFKIQSEKKNYLNYIFKLGIREKKINDMITKTKNNYYNSLTLSHKNIESFFEKKNKITSSLNKKKIRLDYNLISPYPIHQKIKSFDSETFPTIPSQRTGINNLKLKQIRNNLLEKQSQNFINKYVHDIKNIFLEKNKKKDKSLSNIKIII